MMSVTYKTFPCVPRKIVTEPKWAEGGEFLGATISYTASVSPVGIATDIGVISYWRPAEEMSEAERATYVVYAGDFDARAIAEIGCEDANG
jgi:hypothetical protein